ncbi:MAG: IS1380 family transposase [Candidatus Eisenbacteria bacterium]
MANDSTQSVLFPELFDRPLVACFDRPHASSDGGAILLSAADRRLGLMRALTSCLRDERDPAKIRHGLDELLAQRVFGLACGYEDANDAARLAGDPIHKLLLGRDAVTGEALASQPTLSRFENGVTRTELLRMSRALFETVVARHARRLRGKVRTITIDLDVTDDPTHGQQELAFFHGHYGHWCYLPLLAYLTFNGEPDQHLVAAMLRSGRAPTTLGALAMLKRIVGELQERFPRARLLVRLDGGFAGAELLEFLDEVGVGYAVGVQSNAVLARAAETLLVPARLTSEITGMTEHVYGECRYAARTWDRARRVVIKAEVVCHEGRPMRDNPRFVVTNLKRAPQRLYEDVYCMRGEIENRIKELHHGLSFDRTSCTRFLANQLRVLLTAAAYVLMQELRHAAAGTSLARAQVITLRERLFKLGAEVAVSVRRVVLHLPASFAFRGEWRAVAMALGARAG